MVARTSLQLPLRLLNDSAHLLESLENPQTRERHVLELLKRIVPYDQCVLLKAEDSERQLVIVPETTKNIVDANDAFLRVSGYKRADLSGGLDWKAMTPLNTSIFMNSP